MTGPAEAKHASGGRTLRILIAEDNAADAELVTHTLRRSGYAVTADLVDAPEAYRQRLAEADYDVILADYNLGPWTGLEALEILQQSGRDIPFILVTATLGDERAVECIKKGIADYVLKDRLARLPLAIEQVLSERRLRAERKRSEAVLEQAYEALRFSEEKFAKAFRSAPDGVTITTLEGGRLIEFNDAFLRIMGYAREEVLGRSVFDLNLWEDSTRRERLMVQLCEKGRVSEFEGRVRMKSGEVRDILFSAELIHLQGEPCMLAVARDITEQKRAQEALRHSYEEVERYSRELERERTRLRTLSRRLLEVQEEERRRIGRDLHDQIGQLLTAARLTLALLQQDLGHLPPEKNRRLEDALGLIDQCLEQTRNLSHLLHPPLLEETGLLSTVRWFLERFTQHTKINVDARLPQSLPRFPHALELNAFRILQECLNNVSRHAEAASVEIELKTQDNYLELSVADRGRGFEASQILGSDQMGVGLAGMQERVRELGGTLEIDSRPGHGTCIRACLPLAGSRG